MEYKLHERTAGHFIKKPIAISARPALEGEIVETREGVLVSQKGDWIITGVRGEIYPIGADILAETYDRVVLENLEATC